MLGCWNGAVPISGTTLTTKMITPRWEGPAKTETSKDPGIEVRWSTLEPSHFPVVCKEPRCMSVVVVCGMRRDETSLPAPRKQHTVSLIKFGEQCYGSSYVQISSGITNTPTHFNLKLKTITRMVFLALQGTPPPVRGAIEVRSAIKIIWLDPFEFHPVIKHIRKLLQLKQINK
jgi:hypothetical protein